MLRVNSGKAVLDEGSGALSGDMHRYGHRCRGRISIFEDFPSLIFPKSYINTPKGPDFDTHDLPRVFGAET